MSDCEWDDEDSESCGSTLIEVPYADYLVHEKMSFLFSLCRSHLALRIIVGYLDFRAHQMTSLLRGEKACCIDMGRCTCVFKIPRNGVEFLFNSASGTRVWDLQ